MLYKISTTICFLFFKWFSRLQVIGRDSIPQRGSFILASNHLSNLDPPLLSSACPRQLAIVAKKELFKTKISSFYFKKVGTIPVERGKISLQTMKTLVKTLAKKPILIFPEGSRGAGLENAQKGAGFLCKKAKVPVIAARIFGTDQILPPGKVFPRRRTVKLVFKLVENIDFSEKSDKINKKIVETIKNIK
ncbi:MAG: 1-acyl-sn-glycerol-3-phosphate acyltransferase [Candidatus Omnitrophica bacterium]|nr:1-acyl-sn-glycerol-3-phosphate acyltransferase [Candidatus Omnitrophota bacterium]MCF7893962.1 1-acyl-sn-glycerol-3-phosphate acyltransferase [Candidatus Omnitrophota bacterium]